MGPLAAQVPDEARIGEMARILAAADARAFDADLIGSALRNADPGVRRQAVLAAGRIGDPAAVDVVTAALADSDARVQVAAAFALGLLKDARAVPALVAFVRSVAVAAQGAPQAEAARALARIGGPEGAAALRDIVGNGTTPGTATPAAVSAALLDAWRLGDRAPVNALASFADDPDPTVRWHALYSVGRLRARQGTALLVAALQDTDPQVRAVAVRGISRGLLDTARIDWHGVRDRIRPLLADSVSAVRVNAARALASFRDSSIAADLVPLLGDRDVNVAVQAETTLGVLGGRAAVTALSGRAQSAVFALRRQAVIGLAQADSTAGAAAVAALASDDDWRWRRAAGPGSRRTWETGTGGSWRRRSKRWSAWCPATTRFSSGTLAVCSSTPTPPFGALPRTFSRGRRMWRTSIAWRRRSNARQGIRSTMPACPP